MRQEYILLFIILLLQIFIVIVFLFKRKENKEGEIEIALYRLWRDTGFEKAIGEINVHLKQLQDISSFFERALRVPQERGNLGEIALESILSDQLPPDMFGIRERIISGKIPDAYIKSTEGIICIDSKFPLENYVRMREASDPKDKEEYKKRFLNDVRAHLDKIEKDYVSPEVGTAPYAFAYLPSESIYWFLVNEAFDLLRYFVKRGVHVVSPLTFSHKIELIKAGVQAKRLSERAEKIREELEILSDGFRKLDERWRVFYDTHLRNLWNKAGEVDLSYRELREKFDRLNRNL